MKYRSDYVTNSSSSSFVIGFKAKESILEELESKMAHAYAGVVEKDINEEDSFMDHDEAIDFIKEENEWSARWIAGERHGKSFSENLQWVETEDGKKEAEKVLNEIIQKAEDKMKNYNVFAVVEYEDHSTIGSELEHEILPFIPNTICRLSHH